VYSGDDFLFSWVEIKFSGEEETFLKIRSLGKKRVFT